MVDAPSWKDNPDLRDRLYLAFNALPIDEVLKLERRVRRWSVKQQATAVGLDRSDFDKAKKMKLPVTGRKQARFAEYIGDLPVVLAAVIPARYLTAFLKLYT